MNIAANSLITTITGSAGAVLALNGAISSTQDGVITWTLAGSQTGIVNGVISNGSGVGAALGLVKDNTGVWTLSNTANTFSGPVWISTGGLTVNTIANSGVNSSLGSGSVIAFGNGASTGTLTFSNGGSTMMSMNRALTLSSASTGGAAIINNNTLSTATVLLNGLVTVNTGVKSLTLGGSNLGVSELASTLSNGLGTLGLQKEGAGAWLISAANSHTGTTVLNAGTLVIGHNQALGTGTISLKGGALATDGADRILANDLSGAGTANIAFTGAGGLTLNGTLTVGNGLTLAMMSAATMTINGGVQIAELATARTLTISGTGKLVVNGDVLNGGTAVGSVAVIGVTNGGSATFAGNNTYSGATIIQNGATLIIGTGGNTGGMVSAISMSNGNLVFNRTGTMSYTAIIGGGGGITFTNTANYILSGASTFTSAITIGGGATVTQVSAAGLGNAAAGLNIVEGTIQTDTVARVIVNGQVVLYGPLTLSGATTMTVGGVITNSGGDRTITVLNSAGVSLTGAINLAESGGPGRTLNLSGIGATTVTGVIGNGGASPSSLLISNTGAGVFLSSASTYSGMTTIANGAKLTIGLAGAGGAVGSLASNITNSGELVFNRNNAVTYTGVISGTGNVTLSNALGIVTLSGGNTYSGLTSLISGTLIIANDTAIGTGTLVGAGGRIQADTVARTLANSIFLSTTLTIAGTQNLTLNGNIEGAGGLFIGGPTTLNGANTYTGGTTIAGGIVTINSNSSFSSGPISISTGGLSSLDNRTFSNQFSFFGGGAFTFTGGGAFTIDAPGLIKTAFTATTTLTTLGGVTFKDEVVFQNGAQVILGAGAFNFEGGISVMGGNTSLSVYTAASSATIGNVNLSADGLAHSLTLRTALGNTLIVNGTIDDGGAGSSLYLPGAGLAVIYGHNTYSGGTTIGGAGSPYPGVYLGHDQALGTGVITMSVGSLGSTGGPRTIGNDIILNGSTGTAIVFSLTGNESMTLAGDITVDGFDQRMYNYIPNMQHQITGDIILGRSGTARSFAIYAGVATNTYAISGQIKDAIGAPGGGMSFGLGTYIITGSNSYTGGTTLGTNLIAIGNDHAFGTGNITLTVAAFSGSGARSIGNNILQVGSLSLTGSSSLTLNGNITISGAARQIANNAVLGAQNTLNSTIFLGVDANPLTLTLAGVAGGTLVLNGTITSNTGGTGGSVAYSAGAVVLNSANSYGGFTTVAGAILQVNNAGAFGASTLTVGSGTIVPLANLTLTSPISVGTTLTLGGMSTLTLNGAMSGPGSVLVTNTGSEGVTLLGSSSFAGITAIFAGAKAMIGNGGSGSPLAGTLTVTGNAIYNRSGSYVFGNVLTGTGLLTFTNNGTVTFSTANTFAGMISVQQGAITISGGNDRIGTASSLDFASGVNLTLLGVNQALASLTGGAGGASISNGTAATTAVLSVTNGSWTGLITNGTGIMSLSKGGTGTLTLGSANSYSGGTTLGTGTLVMGTAGSIGTGTLTAANAGTLIGTGPMTIANNILLNGGLTIGPFNGNLTLTGAISNSGTNRTLTIANSGFTTTINNVGLSESSTAGRVVTFSLADNANVIVAGLITNSNGLAASPAGAVSITGGAATLTIFNQQNYTGNTIVGGNVKLVLAGGMNNQLLGSVTRTLTLRDNALLDLFGTNQTFTNVFGDAGTIITNNGSVDAVLTTTGDAGVYNGVIKDGLTNKVSLDKLAGSSDGIFTLGGDNTYSGATTVRQYLYIGTGGATGSIKGNITNSGLVVWSRTGSVDYSGVITGTGTLTLTGGASFIFRGASTSTGATTIGPNTNLTLSTGAALGNSSITVNTGATLQVDALATLGTSGMTVNDGGTFIMNGYKGVGIVTMSTNTVLRGIGQIDGPVTMNPASSLILGGMNSAGTMTLGGLTLGGGILNYDLGLLNSDLLRVMTTTQPTITAASTININFLNDFTAGTYTLISGYTGLITNTEALTINAPTGYSRQLISTTGNLQISFNAVSQRVWDGAISRIWDVNTTSNFTGSVFNESEGVEFLNSSTTSDILLSNGGSALLPSSVLVNNSSTTYTFSGDPIGGVTGLIKQGTGLLVLLNENTFTGGVNVSGGGKVQIGNGGTAGSISTGATITLTDASTIDVHRSTGMLSLNSISGSGNLIVRGGGGVIFAGGNTYTGYTSVTGGELRVTGTATMSGDSAVTVNNGLLSFLGTRNQEVAQITLTNNGVVNVNSSVATGTVLIPSLNIASGTFNVNTANVTINSLTLGDGSGAATALTISTGRTASISGTTTYVASASGATIGGDGLLSLGTTLRNVVVEDGVADNDLTISAKLGAASTGDYFRKTGAGTLYVSSINSPVTFAGGFGLVEGKIIAASEFALGGQFLMLGATTATLAFEGSAAKTLTTAISLNATGTLSITGSSDLTFARTVTNNSGPFIPGRTLALNTGPNTTGTFSKVVISDDTTARGITFGGSARSVFLSIDGGTSPGSAGIASQFAVNGTGTFEFFGNNAYSGGTSIMNGTAIIHDAGNFGVGSSAIGISNTTMLVNPSLLMGSDFTFTRAVNVFEGLAGSTVVLGGSAALTSTFTGNISFSNELQLSAIAGGTAKFNGVLDDGGALVRGITKIGAGTVELNGANLFQGGTTVSAGTLRLGNASALGAAVSTLYVDVAGTLDLNGFSQAIATLTDGPSGGGMITSASAATLTVSAGLFSGSISGVTAVNKVGAGTLTLFGTNTYAGPTTVSAGTLQIGNGGATGSLASDVTNSAAVVFNRSGSSTYRNVISGNGTVTIAGGTVSFTGANTYTGATTVAGGTLDVVGSLGNTTVTVAAGAALIGTGSIAGPVNLAATGTLGGSLTITSGVDSVGTIAPGSGGVGTLTLGSLILHGGILQFGLQAPGASDAITILLGGNLSADADVSLQFANLGGLTSGTYNLVTGYSGLLSGATFNHLLYNTSLGGFTFTLHNNAGSLDLEVGTGPTSTQIVWTGATDNLWNTTSTNWSGDTVKFTDGVSNVTFDNTTLTNNVTVTSNGVTPQNMTVDNDPSHTYVFSGGAITGTGLLLKQGTGTLVFTNDASFLGGVSVAGGTLQIGNGATTGSLANDVANNGVLAFNRSDAFTFTGVVSGSGALVQAGSGTVILTGNQTFTGPTTVQSGVLQLGGDYASDLHLQNALLQLSTTGNQTLTGLIAGTGFLQKLGTGTTTLLGVNTFSGITSVDAGTLVVNHALSGTVFVNAGGAFTGSGASTSQIVVQGGSGSITGTQSGELELSSGSVTIASGGVTTGTVAVGGGQLIVASGGQLGNTLGVNVTGGTLNVQTGGQIVGNGQINVAGTLIANGDVQGTVTVNAGGMLHGNGSVGAIVLQNGGTLSVGNSVGSLTIDGDNAGGPSLTLNAGSVIEFEFNDVDAGPGVGWDYVELGAGMLTINAQNQAGGDDRVLVHINSLNLANAHGANDFNAAAATPSTVQEYYWKFIGLNDLSQISTTGPSSLSGRFHVVDDLIGAGVFDLADGNPYDRPINHLGEGTFRVLAGNFGQGNGLYIYYSAVPEPGSMLLAGLGSLAAGWYGRRRLRRKQNDEVVTSEPTA